MSNIFNKKDNYTEQSKRNTFDLSFTNNGSFRFGRLYPVFLKEVNNGDSMRIKSNFAFNFMPTVFPVQTKMYANLSFFYVRNRILWKDWKDFQYKTKENLIHPYISTKDPHFFENGSLADYLGVPTQTDNIEQNTPVPFNYARLQTSYIPYNDVFFKLFNYDDADQPLSLGAVEYPVHDDFLRDNFNELHYIPPMYDEETYTPSVYMMKFFGGPSYSELSSAEVEHNMYRGVSIPLPFLFTPVDLDSDIDLDDYSIEFDYFVHGGDLPLQELDDYFCYLTIYNSYRQSSNGTYNLFMSPNNNYSKGDCVVTKNDISFEDFTSFHFKITFHTLDDLKTFIFVYNSYSQTDNVTSQLSLNIGFLSGPQFPRAIPNALFYYDDTLDIPAYVNQLPTENNEYFNSVIQNGSPCNYLFNGFTTFYRLPLSTSVSPFIKKDDDTIDIPISALPFRAYESVYNAYYRNQEVDPLLDNQGQPEYNLFNTTVEGGADTTNYHFFNAYYEKDFLTSAKKSPQYGVAPLVGVSSMGKFTFKDEQGVSYTAQAVIGADGETLTGISSFDEKIPRGSLDALQDAITHGISINDFRNVNAFQRWLENTMRRGYRYKDLVKTHTGVNISAVFNDMPEFIGGVREIVDVNKVVNTAESLGEFCGLPSCFAQSRNDVNAYFDETGFVIGVLSFVPVPIYTQIIPKFYLYKNPLDYYNLEFGKIGLQPIYKKEVSPVQVAIDKLFGRSVEYNDVFGYQRPWYNLLSSVDEAHGELRSTLSNYVMYRQFLNSPSLNKDFIEVKSDDTTDVFADTTDNDKIVGLINFEVICKRSIPTLSIPSIE